MVLPCPVANPATALWRRKLASGVRDFVEGAAAEAVEEAIINALLAGEGMSTASGTLVPALDVAASIKLDRMEKTLVAENCDAANKNELSFI